MILRWVRGSGGNLSKHFKASEFECNCGCIEQQIDSQLIDKLEELRYLVKIPIMVTSAYRCLEKQKQLESAGYQTVKNSQHLLGRAADLTCGDLDSLLLEAHKVFKAIGVARNFIHVDLRDDKVRIWSYK